MVWFRIIIQTFPYSQESNQGFILCRLRPTRKKALRQVGWQTADQALLYRRGQSSGEKKQKNPREWVASLSFDNRSRRRD